MEKLKTEYYLQKRIVNFLFNEKWYNRIKLFRIIFDFKLKQSYEMSKLLKYILQGNSIIFDIGANMGQYACRFNSIVNKGKGHVYCFEPVEANFVALKNMKKILKLNNISLNKLGVSNVVETTIINIPVFNNGLVVGTQATLLDLKKIKHRTEAIKVTTIDNYFLENKIEKVDFIKCDTEGNENKVLEGGKKTIANFLPILSLEMSYNDKGLDWLLDLGYKLFYYDNTINRLREVDKNQKGNLILINEKQINSLSKIIKYS